MRHRSEQYSAGGADSLAASASCSCLSAAGVNGPRRPPFLVRGSDELGLTGEVSTLAAWLDEDVVDLDELRRVIPELFGLASVVFFATRAVSPAPSA